MSQDFLTETVKDRFEADLECVRGRVSPNGQLSREANGLVFQTDRKSSIMSRRNVYPLRCVAAFTQT